MNITELFFDEALYPKLIYSYQPGSQIGQSDFRFERMNLAAESWIRDNLSESNLSLTLDAVFESWGVHELFTKLLEDTRRDGRCFSSLFAQQKDAFVVLDAFKVGDRYVGVSFRSNDEVRRAFPINVFLSVSLDILCIADPEGRFVRVNSEFTNLLGYQTEDVEGHMITEFIHPEDLPSTLSAVDRLNSGDPVPNYINRYRTKSGEYRFLQWRSVPFPPYIIASARDITEAFSLSLSLEKEFTRDALTGAANRKYFEREARRLVEQYNVRGVTSSLLMVDIDHFKRVNDTYGHPVGDKVLISLAELLIDNCRSTDTTSRVGGEEFAILLPGTDSACALAVAEKMREAIASFNFDDVGHITASIGVSELLPEDDLQRWYTRADTALYLAKNNGRNRSISADMLNLSDDLISVMPWVSEFETGNELLDKEHRALFRAGERLLEAYYNQDADEEARRLDKLFHLLTDHFRSEEKILQEAGYLDLPIHREIHQSLIVSAKFWKALQKNGRIRSSAFYGFLINKVIGDHLTLEDSKFFPLLREKSKN